MKAYFHSSLQALIGGLGLLIAGIVMLICLQAAPLAWTLAGLGFLLTFVGLTGVISARQIKRDNAPREIKIAVGDERNIVIADKTKVIVHDFSVWALWAVIVVLAFMQIELWLLFVLVGVQVSRLVVSVTAGVWLRRKM